MTPVLIPGISISRPGRVIHVASEDPLAVLSSAVVGGTLAATRHKQLLKVWRKVTLPIACYSSGSRLIEGIEILASVLHPASISNPAITNLPSPISISNSPILSPPEPFMQTTLALTLTRQLSARNRWLTDVALVTVGSLLVTLMSQISIALPPSPVPITGQTFAVLIVGAVLGSKRGAASLAFYLAQGAAGLPVFAEHRSGLVTLLGPTGGYLFGFVLAAFIVGWLAERGLDRKWHTTLIPFLAGSIVIYAVGLPWLAAFVGWDNAFAFGLWPYVTGDILKLIFAAAALPAAWELVKAFDRS
jgi:biotin transport system substrate-specific component